MRNQISAFFHVMCSSMWYGVIILLSAYFEIYVMEFSDNILESHSATRIYHVYK